MIRLTSSLVLLPFLAGCAAATARSPSDAGGTSCATSGSCGDAATTDSGPSGDAAAPDAGPSGDATAPDSGPSGDAGALFPPADGGSCASPIAPSVCSAPGCSALPPTCSSACAPLGAVHFHLQVPESDAGPYMADVYSWGADPVNWFTVSTAADASIPIVPPTADYGPGLYWSPSCSVCASIPITPLQGGPIVGDAGIDGVWNGTSYSLTSTCDEPGQGQVPCGDVLCAPAGSYVVKMCAAPVGADPANTRCVSVPFEFPGTADVTGVLAL